MSSDSDDHDASHKQFSPDAIERVKVELIGYGKPPSAGPKAGLATPRGDRARQRRIGELPALR